MNTSTLTRPRRRVLAAGTAAALAVGAVVATTPGAAAADPARRAIVSVVKDTADPSGMTVKVSGSGFDPSLAIGTRPPLMGQESGTYVVFGKFADVWQPSKDAPSSARIGGNQAWATPTGAFGATLRPDGTFDTRVTLNPTDPEFVDAPGNWGIYTYAGSGAVVASYETYTPITFNDDFTDFTLPEPPVVEPPVVEPPAPTKVASTAKLKLARKKVTVGTRAKATVRVGAKGVPTVTGKVLVKKGRKTLRTVTLKKKHDGRRTVRLPRLKRGKHKLRAVYQGSALVRKDASKKVTLRVVRKKAKQRR